MIPLIEQHMPEIRALCAKYHVARLDIFGSAANGGFNDVRSDVDFLVEFKPMDPIPYADAYFELADALENLLGRRIDLVTVRQVRNPYFRKSIYNTRQLLYAA